MPQALVRQRRGLVDLYRITSSQRAEHAAVFLLRGSHFTPFRHDVPRVARDGRARRLREGLSCCSREDGEHLCCCVAASSANWLCRELFLWTGCARLLGRERLCARCTLSRGVVKRPTEVETPCPLLPRRQMRRAGLLTRPRWTAAFRRTRPLLGVSESYQTRPERRMPATAHRAGALHRAA